MNTTPTPKIRPMYGGFDQPASFRFDHARGPIYGWFSAKGLYRLTLPHTNGSVDRISVLHSGANDTRVWELNAALANYFAGLHESFASVPLDLDKATDFQREVWDEARRVEWGNSSTYGELALRMNKPKSAARAVGHALGQNPIAIVVPCHRFLGADGSLHGFAAGLEWKRELLQLEGVLLH
ncbi:MAG: methylated-DNA--[protein]-cysteine S-methyltransferase [Candidatus Hydrogenedentes bacterium]|nr:methylated-DNA--[protein]-cysteine S-methyltransferase [Candidatus Hydrogenedentota bacterium]